MNKVNGAEETGTAKAEEKKDSSEEVEGPVLINAETNSTNSNDNNMIKNNGAENQDKESKCNKC